jgi:hypothetical protein
MTLNLEEAVADMERMTAGQLREKYAEVVGEQARSGHKTWLIRRIAWHLQARQEGDLSERARRRAQELANDADVRVTPPRGHCVAQGGGKPVQAKVAPDRRLSGVGEAIVHKYKGRQLRVVVLPDGGFEYEGRRYKSLSAVAKAISGSHCNGFRFFGLEGKR